MTKFPLIAAAVVVASGAFVAQAEASPFRLERDGPWVVTAQDREACAAQPDLAWCNGAAVEKVALVSWSAADVAGFQASVSANFLYSYATDLPWRSHYDAASTGARWVDDCDGLTFTVLDGLARQGFPEEKMFRAVVKPAGNASFVMHMVGIVEVDGIYLVIGDTDYSAPYPLAKATFTPVLLSNVAEGPRWKRAALNARPLARPR